MKKTIGIVVLTSLIFAAVALAGATGTRQRVSSAGGGGTVTAPATGAGTDTCTGAGCAIGASGFGTDGGVSVYPGGVPVDGMSAPSSSNLSFYTSSTRRTDLTSSQFSPATNGAMSLGVTGSRWSSLWLSGSATITGTADVSGDLFFTNTNTSAGPNTTNGNCIRWGPAVSSNTWWMCGIANTSWMFGNNTSTYMSFALSDGFATFSGVRSLLSYSFGTKLISSSTAPTVTGFGTSPSVVANNGTAAFTINVGTGGTANTGTITLPAATTGWVCTCFDVTTPASFVVGLTGGSTTTCTVSSYSRTTGLLTAWTASDILRCTAVGY